MTEGCCNFQFNYGQGVTYGCTLKVGHEGPCEYRPERDALVRVLGASIPGQSFSVDCRGSLPRLIEAVEAYLKTGPCSDPDCCARAIQNADARENLAAVLATVKGAQALLASSQ